MAGSEHEHQEEEMRNLSAASQQDITQSNSVASGMQNSSQSASNSSSLGIGDRIRNWFGGGKSARRSVSNDDTSDMVEMDSMSDGANDAMGATASNGTGVSNLNTMGADQQTNEQTVFPDFSKQTGAPSPPGLKEKIGGMASRFGGWASNKYEGAKNWTSQKMDLAKQEAPAIGKAVSEVSAVPKDVAGIGSNTKKIMDKASGKELEMGASAGNVMASTGGSLSLAGDVVGSGLKAKGALDDLEAGKFQDTQHKDADFSGLTDKSMASTTIRAIGRGAKQGGALTTSALGATKSISQAAGNSAVATNMVGTALPAMGVVTGAMDMVQGGHNIMLGHQRKGAVRKAQDQIREEGKGDKDKDKALEHIYSKQTKKQKRGGLNMLKGAGGIVAGGLMLGGLGPAGAILGASIGAGMAGWSLFKKGRQHFRDKAARNEKFSKMSPKRIMQQKHKEHQKKLDYKGYNPIKLWQKRQAEKNGFDKNEELKKAAVRKEEAKEYKKSMAKLPSFLQPNTQKSTEKKQAADYQASRTLARNPELMGSIFGRDTKSDYHKNLVKKKMEENPKLDEETANMEIMKEKLNK